MPPPPASPPFSPLNGDAADTILCGNISGRVVLQAQINFIVACPVYVQDGALLHIEAGVILRFNSSWQPQADDVDVDGSSDISRNEIESFLGRLGVPCDTLNEFLLELGQLPLSTAKWLHFMQRLNASGAASAIRGASLVVERGGRLVAHGAVDVGKRIKSMGGL